MWEGKQEGANGAHFWASRLPRTFQGVAPLQRCFPEGLLYPTSETILYQKLDVSSGLAQAWTTLGSQCDKTGERRSLSRPPSILPAVRAMWVSWSGPRPLGRAEAAALRSQPPRAGQGVTLLTSCMNFLQTGRISLLRVALNIMHCFSWGVRRKISCTSRRMSGWERQDTGGHECLPDQDPSPDRPSPSHLCQGATGTMMRTEGAKGVAGGRVPGA